MADLMPTHAHQNPLWVLAYDDFPVTSVHEKKSCKMKHTKREAGSCFTTMLITERLSLMMKNKSASRLNVRVMSIIRMVKACQDGRFCLFFMGKDYSDKLKDY